MYNFLKQLSQKLKTPSQHILRPFFNLKRASKLLAITSFFLLSTDANAWFGSSDGDKKNETSVNVPEDIQKDFQEHLRQNVPEIDPRDPTVVALREQGNQIHQGMLEASENSRGLFNGKNSSYDQAEVDRDIEEAIELTQAQLGYTDDKDDRYEYKEHHLKQIQNTSFETSTVLASIAQEPLFLDNKEGFSFEIRPFLSGKNYEHCAQFGALVNARYQWSEKYISGQILSARNIFVHENSRDLIAALTYGHFFNEKFSGSLTLSSGWTQSKLNVPLGVI